MEGLVTEGVSRAERREGVGREEGRRESQHEEGKWVRRVGRQMELDGWEESSAPHFQDRRLCVGTSSRGRRWLLWAASLPQPQLTSLLRVTEQLAWVGREEAVEVRQLVARLEAGARERGESFLGLKKRAVRSLSVLEEAGVVEVAREAGEVWLSVVRGWEEERLLTRLIKVVNRFCV